MSACLTDARLRIVNASSPLGVFPMAVLAGEDLVSREIARRGFWEIRSPNQLLASDPRAALPATGTFVDVGANLGFYSLLFAQYGYNVLVVEPMLLNRKAIETSLCMNPVLARRVTLLKYALGKSATARCVVRADDRNAGNGKLTCSADEQCETMARGVSGSVAAHATICEPVTMSTLDDVLAQRSVALTASPIVAVKMDVEGQECNVLAGGRSLFTTHRPMALVVEANRKHVKACLTRAAADFSYHITPTRPDTLASNAGEGDVNWILTRLALTVASPRLPAAPSQPSGGRAHCTWQNGCCDRHSRFPACKASRPVGAPRAAQIAGLQGSGWAVERPRRPGESIRIRRTGSFRFRFAVEY